MKPPHKSLAVSRRAQFRGVALLIVLATLVLTVTAATILVGAAASHQARSNIDHCTLMVDDLLAAAEAPILLWLAHHSSKVMLPPEAIEPMVPVLHDRWVVNGLECELMITAWDQCGMVPVQLVTSGSPLRLTLPDHLLKRIDAAKPPNEPIQGLDLYINVAADSADAVKSVFPHASITRITEFGEAPPSSTHGRIDDHDAPNMTSLGALVATHNKKPFRINVNTAPRGLIEAALALGGSARSGAGLDSIVAARSQGKPTAVNQRIVPLGESEAVIHLVSSSNLWSFRIDARVGSVRKSWWAVYSPTAKRNSHSTNRVGTSITSSRAPSSSTNTSGGCVQRVLITH